MAGVRLGEWSDGPALRALFAEVFGEGEQGLSLFFSRVWRPENTVVAVHGGEVCGMFYVLPAALAVGGARLPAAYLYALAVAPQRRSQGIAGEILRYLDGLLPARGYAAAVLQPAEESLFQYYARFGYTGLLPAARWQAGAAALPAPAAQVEPVALPALPGGRDGYFAGISPHFSWGEGMLGYAGDYMALAGWQTLLVRGEGGTPLGYGIVRPAAAGMLEACELGGPDPPAVAGALCRHLGAAGVRAVLPASRKLGAPFPRAAAKWLGAGEAPSWGRGYFALGLE